MHVIVHLHTILQQETPQGFKNRIEISLPESSTLGDLLLLLGITHSPDTLLLAVNGRVADVNKRLETGDQVNLMPAISGG
jgi:sulfur carrier protein ThiS